MGGLWGEGWELRGRSWQKGVNGCSLPNIVLTDSMADVNRIRAERSSHVVIVGRAVEAAGWCRDVNGMTR